MTEITIGGKTYNVEEARSEEELHKGLKGVKELPEDGGMLFYMLDELSQQVFTMKGMNIPLDIIFINLDLTVVDVAENCKPKQPWVISSTENMDEDDIILYVLEVNPNSGIKIGDELEFVEDSAPVMKVLNQDGSTLMELWGGERIISRKETKVIIKKAKKAESVLNDPELYINKCKSLGKYIFKVIKGLDTRPADYVKSED